jgi:hypothetical protein
MIRERVSVAGSAPKQFGLAAARAFHHSGAVHHSEATDRSEAAHHLEAAHHSEASRCQLEQVLLAHNTDICPGLTR